MTGLGLASIAEEAGAHLYFLAYSAMPFFKAAQVGRRPFGRALDKAVAPTKLSNLRLVNSVAAITRPNCHHTLEAWLNYIGERTALYSKPNGSATDAVAYRDWIHIHWPTQQEHQLVLG
jgi:hypothetical protein